VGRISERASHNLVALTAVRQRGGGCQLWALDKAYTLMGSYQTSPGGNWVRWMDRWNQAPPLRAICAVERGGDYGSTLWGVDLNGKMIATTLQHPSGGWTSWSDVSGAPPNPIALAALNHRNDCCELWAVDSKNALCNTHQTRSGGDWTTWAIWLTSAVKRQ